MAYIEPNSTVQLMTNVPLDNSYRDTFWFGSLNAQTEYFNQFIVQSGTFEKQYYQRYRRNYIKLEGKAENYNNVNYMRFRNISHGNKWFYAFVLDVQYINENTFMINYELDVMQTWFFDFHQKECFVEREHAWTDNVGDNLEPEPVELGDYVCYAYENDNMLNNVSIVIGIGFLQEDEEETNA